MRRHSRFVSVVQRRRVRNAISATNNAEPIIDQTIGKLVVPIRTGNSSGRPRPRAIHIPTIAPTKPSAIDTRQPPREKPVIACPNAPQIPATISKMIKSNNVIVSELYDYSRFYKRFGGPGMMVRSIGHHRLPGAVARDDAPPHTSRRMRQSRKFLLFAIVIKAFCLALVANLARLGLLSSGFVI